MFILQLINKGKLFYENVTLCNDIIIMAHIFGVFSVKVETVMFYSLHLIEVKLF